MTAHNHEHLNTNVLIKDLLMISGVLIALSFLAFFLIGQSNTAYSQNIPANPTGGVFRSGRLSLLWGDGKPGTNASQLVASLTEEGGNSIEIAVPDTLAQQHGGILALDRRNFNIRGHLKEIFTRGKGEQVLEAESIEPAESQGGFPVLGDVAAAVTGSQPWVNILCKYPDIASEPKDLSYFQGMFSSTKPGLNHYWQESSYDLININGTGAFGWYTLPNPRSFYTALSTSAMLTTIFNDCTTAANPDVNFPDYVGINLMLNGELDGSAWGGSRYATLDGTSRFWYSTWEPPWGYGNQTVIAHEMGHGFGLPHSSSQYGGSYSNKWDVMSDSWANCSRSTDPIFGCLGQHTISYHKDKLQWIPSSQKQTVSSGTQTITLERLALPQTSDGRMIVLPVNGSQTMFYTVEVRRWAGYDVKLPLEGVIIHQVNTTTGTPAVVIDADNNGNTGDAGAAWGVGESFSDTAYGITVTINSETATGYVVTVTNNPGTLPTPTPTPTLAPTPTPTPTLTSGDANGDGNVDATDYAIWLSHYNQQTGNGASDADFDGNGIVDGVDYVIWLIHYGT
jgi:M6 family metalloprotease-like protein